MMNVKIRPDEPKYNYDIRSSDINDISAFLRKDDERLVLAISIVAFLMAESVPWQHYAAMIFLEVEESHKY